ncbi:MAG TPA: Rieske (2Fe-2S) protein [Sporichthyaceae bacterium]|jgi:nitrite reductase/ring-hydroxylating ferredoxin subunit|nr:Rieske (2Fe-2S) protein [Sporichthyaceae bacterium]
MIHDRSPDSAVDARGDALESGYARRAVLRGALTLGAVGIGGALAGAAAAPAGTGRRAGAPLGPASAIPVGGGVIYDKAKVVVTQPTAGVYKAFDAMCTHQKCLLAEVKGGTINCACHGAKYSITDGSVVHPPATVDLPPRQVTVSGGNVSVT